MKKILISGVLATSLLVFSYTSLSWGQTEEKKTLSAEEAAEAQKKLEEAQQKLRKTVKNVPKVENAGSITGVVTCQKMRNNADAVVFIEKVGENKFDPPAPAARHESLFVPG